jgi:SAM-dependent methyltransferase
MPKHWNDNAHLRASQISSGKDITFSRVFVPYYKEIVASRKPTSLLEIGCGTGHLSLELGRSIPRVFACEPSPGMYNVAEDTLKGTRVRLENCTVQELQRNVTFDLVICHMCVHTSGDLESFLESARAFLHDASLFVFSIPHPCFYNEYKQLFPPANYSYMTPISRKVSFPISAYPGNPIRDVPYFHRPLEVYFNTALGNGLYIERFREIFPDSSIQKLYGEPWKTPHYCVFHMRRA